jgi:polyisoprenoid-binding protein YceI
MLRALALALTLALPVQAQDLPPPEAGQFRLDLGHTRILFRVNHLGFSNYIGFFREAEATLDFNPEAPETMQLSATVKAGSVETMYPDAALDFNAVLAGADLLDAGTHPEITFVSTDITVTGANTADVTGDFTLRGVTRPLTLAVTYNGGYGAFAMDPSGARIGFSATGAINRSDFGMDLGIPAPGTTFGVGDRVEIIIETELTNPDAAKP